MIEASIVNGNHPDHTLSSRDAGADRNVVWSRCARDARVPFLHIPGFGSRPVATSRIPVESRAIGEFDATRSRSFISGRWPVVSGQW